MEEMKRACLAIAGASACDIAFLPGTNQMRANLQRDMVFNTAYGAQDLPGLDLVLIARCPVAAAP